MRNYTKTFIYVLREKIEQFFILFLFVIIGIIVITSGRAKAQYQPAPYLAPWANPAPSMFSPYSPNMPGYGPSPYQPYGNIYPGGNIPYGFSGSSGTYPSFSNAGYNPSYNIGSASYGYPGGYPSFYNSGYYPSFNMGYASYLSPPHDPPEYIREVEVVNDYAYLLVTRQNDLLLKAVDITDPDDPQIEKSLKLGDSANYFNFHSQGNYLYWISMRFTGYGDYDDEPDSNFPDEREMGSIDISNPDDPKKLDTFETGLDSAYTMKEDALAFFSQDRAYIYYNKIKKRSTYMSGLEVIDLSDPQDLNQSSFGEIHWPNNSVPYMKIMTANDNLLFLCSYDNDSESTYLYFIDISDPQNPTMEASLELPESRRPDEQIIIGSYLYLLSSRIITVVNIQDVTQPQVVTALELPDPEETMILEGNLLYIADGSRGLVVLDVTSPEKPQKQAGYRLMKNDRSKRVDLIEVKENLVFGTTFSSCLQIWDISDPEDVKKEGKVQLYASSDYPTDYSERPAISGQLEITLTHEAQDTVDLDKDGDIAIFGIDSLDDLNRSYEVDKITPPEKSTDEWNGQNDRPTRRYTLHFPDSVDLYEIRDEYEENSCCVIVELAYKKTSPDNSYSNSGYFGYGWNPTAYAGYGFPSAGYGNSYPLMSSGFPGSSFAQFNQFDPLRYQSGPAGSINPPSPWYPQSSVFPGGNWSYPAADTYSFGQAYPGSMWASPNPQGPIYSGYPGGNNPWSFPSNFNPLGSAINPSGFNMWGPGQYNFSSWGLPDAGAFWSGFGY